MRLIDADALKATIVQNYRKEFFGSILWNILDDMPTIDAVQVVHGQWVKANGMMPPEYHGRKCCSVCDAFALSDFYGRERLSDVCPNCGAKMDLEKD